jgi:hypothetical protein
MSFASCLRALVLVPSVLFLGTAAQAQEVELRPSLICNTERQVERFIALYDGDARTAISAVNSEVHDPTACGLVNTAYVRGRQLATARNKDITFGVVEILVSASSMKKGAWNPLPPRSSTRSFPLRTSRFSGQSHRHASLATERGVGFAIISSS